MVLAELKCKKCGQVNKLLVTKDAEEIKCAFCANKVKIEVKACCGECKVEKKLEELKVKEEKVEVEDLGISEDLSELEKEIDEIIKEEVEDLGISEDLLELEKEIDEIIKEEPKKEKKSFSKNKKK